MRLKHLLQVLHSWRNGPMLPNRNTSDFLAACHLEFNCTCRMSLHGGLRQQCIAGSDRKLHGP